MIGPIITREQWRDAISSVLILGAIVAVAIYFRADIASVVGETAATWLI